MNAVPVPRETFEVPQPKEWQVSVDGVFIKQMFLTKRGHIVAKHTHDYDHHSMLARGAIRVWVDDVHRGDFMAPMPILIERGKAHKFQALADNTIVYCIHNLHGKDEVEILAQGRL